MKTFFTNLFSKKQAINKGVSDLAAQIFVGALASAQGVVNVDEYRAFPMFRITTTLCSGYLNIVDRYAFSNIPNKRPYIMEQLMANIASDLIETFVNGRLELDNPKNAMIDELNSGQISLGQFTKFAPTAESESPKGTFMWEFGKMFAKDLGCEEDITVMELGISLLSNMAEAIKLNDYISS